MTTCDEGHYFQHTEPVSRIWQCERCGHLQLIDPATRAALNVAAELKRWAGEPAHA